MDILDELKALTQKLRGKNIDYALCGGLALAIYALPRAAPWAGNAAPLKGF